MEPFYYEYDNDEEEYAICEEGGGYEHGATFDIVHFWTLSQTNAEDAVNLLNKIWKTRKNKYE